MPPEPALTSYLVTDLGGVTRGRALWRDIHAPLQASMGWVPVNQLISPLDTIPAKNPFGSHGDCRLFPDADTLVDIKLQSGKRVRFVLCDVRGLDGADIGLCARSFLKDAVSRLESLGLTILAAFEQEYWVESAQVAQDAPGFTYQRFIRHEPLCTQLAVALEAAGLQPETLLPEFAPHQFELTLAPSSGVVAADRAVASREIARAVAHDLGAALSFTPAKVPGGVCSGTHVHLSLWTLDGRPALYDPTLPGCLSATGAAFCAGIVRHMRALCALCAPTPISYERLQPHRWSSAYTCMGDRNREAALRICPVVKGDSAAAQFNLEYRAVDATANPYLVLGALIRSGIEGITQRLPLPPLIDGDPSEMAEEQRMAAGVRRLPESLAASLAELRADQTAAGWLPRTLYESFLLMKSAELEACAGLDMEALCKRYASIF